MKTIDDALAFADTFDKPANKHMSKITHTPNPLITSTGFIPDENTRQNDEYFRLDAAVAALRAEVLGGGE